MTTRLATYSIASLALLACSGPPTRAERSRSDEAPVETTHVASEEAAPEQAEADIGSTESQWMVWRPCGCSEGCARVNVGSIAEGAEVVVGETWAREGPRVLEPGSHVRVESTEALGGGTVQVLTNLEGLCGYLCQTDYAGPVAPNACADGHFAARDEAELPPASSSLAPRGSASRGERCGSGEGQAHRAGEPSKDRVGRLNHAASRLN